MKTLETSSRKEQVKSVSCPDCRRKMTFKGCSIYECNNENCAVIKAKFQDGVILKVWRDAVLMNNPVSIFFSGVCPRCGKIVERIMATLAVCEGRRGSLHPLVEIELSRGVIRLRAKGKKG